MVCLVYYILTTIASDAENNMYSQDYMDSLLKIEQNVRDYRNQGDKNIFKNYFDLTARLETEEFCSFVDTNQVGQSTSKDFD